jgi:excisionase family DNA binding protein
MGVVVLSAEDAARINRKLGLDNMRAKVRGADAELDSILMSIRMAAVQWQRSALGTKPAPTSEPRPVWITTKEAAKELGDISTRRVCKLIELGALAATKDGVGCWHIRRDDLELCKRTRKA